MATKTYKPTSPGIRFQSHSSFDDITKARPEKALTKGKPKTGGRSSTGRVTSRFIGGGHKQKYRQIDFRRDKHDIIAPDGLQVGTSITSGPEADILVGNALPLAKIPLGTTVHCIELKEGKGAQMARSAGTSAQLMAREGDWATLRLPSGEMRKVHVRCYATIGQVGNIEHENVSIGKAGRTRHMGKKPHNRGVSMNPVDHPLGGGEGKTSGGRHPVTPWGKPTKGYKTRKNKRTTKFIVKRRTK